MDDPKPMDDDALRRAGAGMVETWLRQDRAVVEVLRRAGVDAEPITREDLEQAVERDLMVRGGVDPQTAGLVKEGMLAGLRSKLFGKANGKGSGGSP